MFFLVPVLIVYELFDYISNNTILDTCTYVCMYLE